MASPQTSQQSQIKGKPEGQFIGMDPKPPKSQDRALCNLLKQNVGPRKS